jgi:hypothetical protein
LDFIVDEWEPGMKYPVLAVANGDERIPSSQAYASLCRKPYHDMFYNEETSTGFRRSKCNKTHLDTATTNLRTIVLAMAESLVGRKSKVSPDHPLIEWKAKKEKRRTSNAKSVKPPQNNKIKEDYDTELFEDTVRSIRESGGKLPKVKEDLEGNENLDGVELLQFWVDQKKVDLYPDPMLLLVKAAINWSWYCEQKLLPACGCATVNDEKAEEGDALLVPSTPIPTIIECLAMPVSPDDHLSL